ncbi:MAG: nicotinamide mononucleotide transporter [Lentimonas sp.]|jgi:nicotinamide mononucleotide transporter
MLDLFFKQLAQTSWVEWLGMVAGITGVWQSIKERHTAWPLFIICYCCYVYISFKGGLHAFMGMNIVFIAISLYGWRKWTRPSSQSKTQLPVSHTPKAIWPWLLALLVLGTAGIGYLLHSLGEANMPYLDAFATSCGLIAQWMLSRKHIENWLWWIASDLVYLSWFVMNSSIPSMILFTVFIGLAIKGWRDWKKGLISAATAPAV